MKRFDLPQDDTALMNLVQKQSAIRRLED